MTITATRRPTTAEISTHDDLMQMIESAHRFEREARDLGMRRTTMEARYLGRVLDATADTLRRLGADYLNVADALRDVTYPHLQLIRVKIECADVA